MYVFGLSELSDPNIIDAIGLHVACGSVVRIHNDKGEQVLPEDLDEATGAAIDVAIRKYDVSPVSAKRRRVVARHAPSRHVDYRRTPTPSRRAVSSPLRLAGQHQARSNPCVPWDPA